MNPTDSSDPYRPRYHFTPRSGWMNDPKPFFWNDEYHVFFQHNPHGAFWGTMHWGHARSRDLVHWEELPIALAPTPGGPDRAGCFTGCVVRGSDDRFHILYTGIPRLKPLQQVQCLASSDDLLVWEKTPEPVIPAPPPGFGECFRDPQAWEGGDGNWYQVIGSELPERQGGVALLYRAQGNDLRRWEYLYPLFVGSASETGHDFECPDFFPLGERHVLLTSRGKTWWHVGTQGHDRRFRRDAWGACDDGSFYAAKTLLDDSGRRLLFGWIKESRPTEAQIADGWSGVLSLPRVVTLGPDGQPRFTPAPELAALRGAQHAFENLSMTGANEVRLGTFGDALEIEARFGPYAGSAGVSLNFGAEHGWLDLSQPPMGPDGLTLRVFIDRSIVEVFVNERTCHTHRVYPSQPGTMRISARAISDGPVETNVSIWEMKANN